MKKLLFLFVFLSVFGGVACRAEDDFRLKYSEAFRKMQEFHKGLYLKEAMERVGKIGVGISGNFLFDIDWLNIRQTELRAGFVSLSADCLLNPVFNLVIEGGINRTAAREVWTVSALLQLVVPAPASLENNPGGTGLEIGFKSYLSNISGESVTAFKIGICSYSFISKNIALTFGTDWITPAFLSNSFEIRGGVKYYFL
ncbi:MAG: hypothetical protein NTX32_01685 [Candidatus Firestonebacteria bacterium]|nr:hypothetical protein [Candidatus Firestonebacteria bacterium]